MIHSVSANQPSFHKVTFTSGLNVVLAERSAASSEKDTRNGLGKSTLIEIIDFCLGSNAVKNMGLIIEPLVKWAFTLDITLGGHRVLVTRSIGDHGRVFIDGATPGWPEQPEWDEESERYFYKIARWRGLLGWALFGIESVPDEILDKPSCRSLLPYFVRKRPDAYLDPFKHFSSQKEGNKQLHIAFLLRMNWEYASQWQNLKDKSKAIIALDDAIKTGVVAGIVGSVGALETQRIQLEEHATAAKEALDSFKVHPQYESIQRDADELTKAIHDATNSNVTDRRRLALYREAVKLERPPAGISMERLYEETGLVFPEAVKHSLAEVRTFHHEIVTNRREFLEAEIKSIQEQIGEREAQIKSLTDLRAESMQILKTHGALQEVFKLQERYVKLQGELDRVKARITELKDLKKTKRKVMDETRDLVRIAELDHEERRGAWEMAVRLFNENSQSLYKSPGKLIIDIERTGYKFRVDIERSGSEGIGKMKIFCFDLAILQLQMQLGAGVDFLIHDTLMYDSVDARQRALAFERAHQVTESMGGQYICTINSDMVPHKDFSDHFDFDQHVRLTLTDDAPSGRLLGIRF